MRTSVFVLLAVVVGYFAYNLWFAPEEEQNEPPTFELAGIESGSEQSDESGSNASEPEASAGFEKPKPLSVRADLDFGNEGDPTLGAENTRVVDRREEAGWKLYGQLKDARNAKDADKIRKLEEEIRRKYKDTDAGRMLDFEAGVRQLQIWRQLGRSKEGLQAAQSARVLMTPALFMRQPIEDSQRETLRAELRGL
ncbi:MAG: hypothetical protein AAGD14_16010, partial [Planctomycetota bacterium]